MIFLQVPTVTSQSQGRKFENDESRCTKLDRERAARQTEIDQLKHEIAELKQTRTPGESDSIKNDFFSCQQKKKLLKNISQL